MVDHDCSVLDNLTFRKAGTKEAFILTVQTSDLSTPKADLCFIHAFGVIICVMLQQDK